MSFDVQSEFGSLDPEAKRALVAMQHAIKGAFEAQDRRNRRPKRNVTELVEEGSVIARPGEVVRVRPSDEDIEVVLPPTDSGNGGEDIIVSFEGDGTAVGKVQVTSMSGTCAQPGTTTLNTPGSYRFTSTGAASEGMLAEQASWSGPAPVSLEDLPPVATDTLLGNISGATDTPVEIPLASLDSTSIVYDAASHTFQRAAVTGAIAASQNGNATLFSGIRDNGSAESDRSNLNFLSTTSMVAVVTDDAGGDELEITLERAALTGAISASQNANATLFAGILDNGSAENDRQNLNFLSTTSITSTVTDDSGNNELEITLQRAALTGAIAASANSNATLFAGIKANDVARNDRTTLNWVDGTSIFFTVTDDAGNDELEIRAQRAPLTGAIAADVDVNATTFAGILDNGGSRANRTNLNFLDNTSISLSVTDDAVNNELEIQAQRAALTGEVTASLNSNTLTVTRSTDFQATPWTGNHQFNGEVRLGTLDDDEASVSGSINITLDAGATRVLITSTANVTLGTISGAADGRVLVVEHVRASGAGNLTVTHSTSANGVACPLAADLVLGNRCSMTLVCRSTVWRVVGIASPEDGKLIAATVHSSGTGTHTFNSRCRRYQVYLKAGNGGGGGANSAAAQCAVGGSGARGAEAFYDCDDVPTSVDYDVGAGGSAGASTGTDGGNGGTTQWSTDTADTILVAGGTGGTGSATASFGSGSGTTTGFSRGGHAGVNVLTASGGTLPSGMTLLWRRSGADGIPGIRVSGTVGWGGGEVAGTGGSVSEDGQGALSLNNTDRGGALGHGGLVVVWEYS